jgi:hypothetical protein
MTSSANLNGWPDPESFASATDWIDGLQTLREHARLSVRDLARSTGSSSSTIGGYMSGRHLPNLASTALVERILVACGVDDERERQAWVDALHRVRRMPGPRPASSPAPFKGLEKYTVAEAQWFCGREELTGRIVDRAGQLPDSPIVLVGASGSGKSSLLAAGVAATMIEQGWACSALAPGGDPQAAFERLTGEIAEHLAAGHRVVAVVDQLEELWTNEISDPQRESAITRLDHLAAQANVVVLAALRADFYAKALTSPSLAKALQNHQIVVGPMASSELVRAITEPARRARLDVEEGLLEVLLRDLAPASRTDVGAYDAGALPLLSYALLQTWQRGGRHRLTVADYRAAGGIAGAVANAAEAVVENLTDTETALARRLFTRLVSVADEMSDTRRRVSHVELNGLDHPGSEHQFGPERGIAEIVELFVAARLLTVAASTVEITHEALLAAWPRLRSWLDADRAGLLVRRRISEAALAWHQGERESDLLLRGGRLEAAQEWGQDPQWQASLNAMERSFVAESIAHTDRERRAPLGGRGPVVSRSWP